MSLVAINGIMRWPAPIFSYTALLHVLTTYLLDSTNDRLAFQFQAPKTGTLDRVEFNVAGGTSLADIRVGWQGVSTTTGFPDGSYTHYADLTGYSAGWQVPSYFGDTGGGSGNRKSVTMGDIVAFVITPTGVGPNITVTAHDKVTLIDPDYMPGTVFNSGAAYALQNDPLSLALYYNGESNPVFLSFAGPAVTALSTQAYSTGNPRQVGMKFTLPFACRAVGAWVETDLDADGILRLYDSNATTDLVNSGSGLTWDKDIPGASTALLGMNLWFPNAIELSANVAYRLALENTSATANTLQYADVSAAGHLDTWPGGQNCHWTQTNVAKASLTGDSDWAQTTTRRPFMGLLIDQIHSGGGGSDRRGAMNGGVTQ